MHNLKLFTAMVFAILSSIPVFVSAQCTISRTSAAATESQVLCVSTSLTPITYTFSGASGAIVSNLPAGVSYTYTPGTPPSGTLTISGTPSQAGSFNYSITPIGCSGGGTTPTANGSIGVTSNNSLFLSSAVGTNNQTRCLNVAITNIAYRAVGATNASVTGLPRGITGAWNSTTSTLTISGAPDSASPVAYSLNYTVSMTGGCVGGNATQTGTISVNPAYSLTLVSPAATLDQNEVCINTPIDTIQFTTRGANGASFFGLPPGITGLWRNDSVLIYGSPSVRGTFIFSYNLTGGPCNTGTRTLTDTLVVKSNTWQLISAPSTANQTRCVNTPIDTIIYRRNGATSGSLGTAPAGITLLNTNDSLLIFGTPTADGIYNYLVTGIGGCTGSSLNTIGGLLTIRPTMTISNPANDSQTVCRGVAIASISFSTVGATSASVTGLPAGLNANFTQGVGLNGTVAITGTPSVRGVFPFRIRLLGGCNTTLVVGGTGAITVNGNTAVLKQKSSTVSGPEVLTTTQTRCVGKPIQNIVVSTTGYTAAAVMSGFSLPAGVSAAFTGNASSGTVTISGTPTAVGVFNFQVRLTTATGCTNLFDTIRGTLTVLDTITWTKVSVSSGDTLNQFSSLDTIRYKGTKGSSGAIFSGLPSGLIGAWNSADSTATIFGIPTVTGLFNYRISFTGRCMNGLSNVAVGIIRVDPPTMGSNGSAKERQNGNGISTRISGEKAKGLQEGLVLYPVPSSGMLNVRGLDLFRKAKLTIVDQSGRQLNSFHWLNAGDGAGEMQLNLDGYASGLYFLHIIDSDFDYMDDLREKSSIQVMRFQIR
jgi:hypothetical protein